MLKHPLLNLLALLIIMYLVICLYLYFMQKKFIYFPSRRIDNTPADLDLPYEDITWETADGREISAWFIPAENAHRVILFCHGNAGNISHRLDSLQIFNQMGFCVLIFDYRGYGNSSGSPSERGTYLDVKGAWNFLVQRKKFQPAHIILFGRSLGGSIAAWLAKENNPGALIIESVFKSVPKIGQSIYPFLPVKLLSRFSYNTEEYIKQIKCPLLVIHSPDDEIIPFSHGADLYRIAGQPKSFLKIRGSHNEGFLLSSDQYIQGMQNFLSALK